MKPRINLHSNNNVDVATGMAKSQSRYQSENLLLDCWTGPRLFSNGLDTVSFVNLLRLKLRLGTNVFYFISC